MTREDRLRHYEQVLDVMAERGIPHQPLGSSRYAGRLRNWVSKQEPARLVDTLLVSAVVEARSCERFAALTAVLDPTLSGFYGKLLASEARHFSLYLDAAKRSADRAGLPAAQVPERLDELLDLDAELITSADGELRFHSGPPSIQVDHQRQAIEGR